jgi:hypothetical protein
MRPRVAPLLGAFVVTAVACATSSPIRESTGGSGTGSFAPRDGGVRSCGVAANEVSCNSCLEASCCTEALACSSDARCLGCLAMGGSSEPCNLDQAFSGFRACLFARCADPCMLGSGAASSSAATTSSSSSASSASSSSGAPLTCATVDGNVGCCDKAGVLHYCDAKENLVDQTCTTPDVCGWNYLFGYYDCVPSPGGSDPSKTYPKACGP